MLKSIVNLTTKQKHKLNTRNSINDGIISKKFVIENREKKIQTHSNIETFKLEVRKYRLLCDTQVKLNGFNQFELHG